MHYKFTENGSKTNNRLLLDNQVFPNWFWFEQYNPIIFSNSNNVLFIIFEVNEMHLTVTELKIRCELLSTDFETIFTQCVWKNEKFTLISITEKISWKQLFSYFFRKTVTFTNFLSKMCESKFSYSVWHLQPCSITFK